MSGAAPKTVAAAPAGAAPTDFDTVADEYDASLPAHVVAHYLAKRVAFIRTHTRPGPTLDLGCGTGVLAAGLAADGYEVTGLDPSRGMLRELRRRRPGIGAVAGGGDALPFDDDSFSLVYCVAVMHHVAEAGAVRATLREMARVTRPGGHVLVWDHNPRNPYWPLLMRRVPQDTGGERLIPEGEIVAGLAAGGARAILKEQLGLVPDFAPRALLPAAAALERVVEKVPGLRRLCAHNVVLAVKGEATGLSAEARGSRPGRAVRQGSGRNPEDGASRLGSVTAAGARRDRRERAMAGVHAARSRMMGVGG